MTHERYYIGGGVISAVLGVSPYQTQLDAFHAVIGDSPEINDETRRFFDRRRALEPYAAQVLEHDTGLKLLRQNERYTDEKYPFLRAEIDFEFDDGGEVANGEFKTVDTRVGGRTWLEDDSGSVQAPVWVVAQGMHGLGVTKRQKCLAVGMIGFDEQRRSLIEWEDKLIDFVRDGAVKFWHEHILPRIPPAPRTVEDVLNWVVPDPTAILLIDGNDYLQRTIYEYLQAREARLESAKQEDALKSIIGLAMGAATSVTYNGYPVLTWKPQTAERVDIGILKAEHPDIYKACLRESESRVMRVSKPPKNLALALPRPAIENAP